MKRTASSIIDSFTKRVGEREQIAPDEWLMAGQFLNVMIGEENARLFELEQIYMKKCLEYIAIGDTNAVAEKKAKATEEYVNYQKQRAFIKQIEEMIRLAKLQSKLAMSEAYGS